MISCTEFIPLYSEFFKFLEAKGGHDAVLEYWYYISDNSIGDLTNPNSLAYKCERLGGFEGARAYWGHTLTEEACDLFAVRDDKNRFSYSHMRHCPSRGMLNELKHVEPYYDYCEHCNVIYARVLEKYGIEYIRDDSMKWNAECRSILFEKGNCPNFDWHNISDEEAKVLLNTNDKVQIEDMKTEDNKYLHRDFHLSGDLALKYCGDKFGDDEVIDFITSYVKNYYSPIISKIKENGLKYLKEWIEKIYETEEASDVLHTELKENKLTVTIDKSPVVEYMHSLNQEPSKYYIEETRTLYNVIAMESGLRFNLKYYNNDGGTQFTFSK
ncbi:MAG: hypothetical protein IKJ68_00270 [Clostridia bacterium]|nr:hypothetical protein [Clostridia bacterium]